MRNDCDYDYDMDEVIVYMRMRDEVLGGSVLVRFEYGYGYD